MKKLLLTMFMAIFIAVGFLSAKTLYLDPGPWNVDNAVFGVHAWGDGTDYDAIMTKVEGEANLYQVEVADAKNSIIFVRLASGTTVFSWNAKWNQTGDITIPTDGTNKFTITAWDNQKTGWSTYTPPTPDPVITIGAIPEIANTTVGETATATLTYTLENADKADVTIEGDGFAAVDNDGTITITFTPEEAGEYTATITITAGEVKETATITAIAIAAEAPKVIQILNVTGPVFEQTVVGESSTATVTYEVVNFDETPSVRVEGEGFVIAGEDEGSVNIMFEPQGAGEFNGTLTITAGEVEKLVPFSAIAVEPTPVVTIKVATPANWESCYIWAWTASGNLYDRFPGAEMTKGDDGFYFIDIETSEAISFLVSDNGADSKKTADYSDGVTESTCFDIDNNALVINSSCEYQDIPEPEPIDPYYAIRGLVSWNMSDDIKLTFDETENQYFIKNQEVDGTASFKIISVDDKGAVCGECWFASVEEGVEVEVDYTDDGNIILPEGKYDIYFKTLTKTIWIEEVKDPVPPTPDPLPVVITFVDEVTFPKTFVGETTNDIIEFTLENAAEDAEVVVEVTGEAFSVAEVQDNFIFLAFAPEAEGEYAGVLTVTVGEVSESLEFTAIASPVEPDPDNTITFTVKVPEGTKECWIAGTSDDEDLAWTFIQMEKVVDAAEDNLYTLTTDKLNGVEWKYSSSNEWKYSEIIDGGGNRTEAGVPYDVVTAWQALYDPDFEPIDPYYAIRGLGVTGDAWNAQYEIKLTFNENDENPEWYITGLQITDGQEFKVVYVDEDGVVCSECWYGTAVVEFNPELGDYIGPDNIVLPAGSYDIYFKEDIKSMWIQPSTEGPTTDAEEAIEDLIYSIDGTIYAPAPFAIIDLVGKDVTKANGSLEGAYIVKTQNSVTKVLVK